jgi:hypothetical protein
MPGLRQQAFVTAMGLPETGLHGESTCDGQRATPLSLRS